MNLKSVSVVLGVVAVGLVLFLGVAYLYQYAGLKNYIKAVRMINSLPDTAESKLARNNFYGDFESTTVGNTYGGVLGRVDKKGIWIWGKSGMKYFSVGKNAGYRLIEGCPNNVVGGVENEAKEKLATGDYAEWVKNIKVGDNVVVLSNTKVGLFGGVMNKEVFDFKWWYFLAKDPEKECEK